VAKAARLTLLCEEKTDARDGPGIHGTAEESRREAIHPFHCQKLFEGSSVVSVNTVEQKRPDGFPLREGGQTQSIEDTTNAILTGVVSELQQVL